MKYYRFPLEGKPKERVKKFGRVVKGLIILDQHLSSDDIRQLLPCGSSNESPPYLWNYEIILKIFFN